MATNNVMDGEGALVGRDGKNYRVTNDVVPYAIAQRDADGNLPAGFGDITGVTAGDGLTGGGTTGTVTLAAGHGTANQVTGTNNAGTLVEQKTIAAGTNITVTHGVGTITIGSTAGGDTVNIQTLAASKTLVAGTDDVVQILNPDGAARTVTLQTTGSPTEGSRFEITNAAATDGAWYLNVYNGATFLCLVPRGARQEFIFNGTDWVGATNGVPTSDTQTPVTLGRAAKVGHTSSTAVGDSANAVLYAQNTALGASAAATGDSGTAVGYGATSSGSYSTAVGNGAVANDQHATTVGYGALAEYYATAIGTGSSARTRCTSVGGGAIITSGKADSVAVGYNSVVQESSAVAVGADAKCTQPYTTAIGRVALADRYGEESSSASITLLTTHRASAFNYKGQTTDATPAELLVRGVASQRLTLGTNHHGCTFTARIVAYDTTDQIARGWKLEGTIKRIADGTVSLCGTVTKTDTGTDGGNLATADVAATADDTNKALVLTVTGVAATTINWTARVETVEYHA